MSNPFLLKGFQQAKGLPAGDFYCNTLKAVYKPRVSLGQPAGEEAVLRLKGGPLAPDR
jgi:hypothetical protein